MPSSKSEGGKPTARRITPAQRVEIVSRIRAQLAKGVTLAVACEVEHLKVTTFLSWMRWFGPSGGEGCGIAHPITRNVLLGAYSEYADFGGPGSSFTGRVLTRLVARFDPASGVELLLMESSPSVYIGDDGGRSRIGTFCGILRSISEIEAAVAKLKDRELDPDTAARRARQGFPWLPETLES